MALGAVYTALKTLIGSSTAVTDLIADAPAGFGGGPAIYDDGGAPQSGRVMPDLTVGAGTQVRFNTIRDSAWNCTVQIKVTWQGYESVGQTIQAALAALLYGGRPLTVAGYTSSWIGAAPDDYVAQPVLVTTIAGVVTRELPIIVRVFAT